MLVVNLGSIRAETGLRISHSRIASVLGVIRIRLISGNIVPDGRLECVAMKRVRHRCSVRELKFRHSEGVRDCLH